MKAFIFSSSTKRTVDVNIAPTIAYFNAKAVVFQIHMHRRVSTLLLYHNVSVVYLRMLVILPPHLSVRKLPVFVLVWDLFSVEM